MVENYEVHNPAVQALLRDIGGKIGGVLPAGWGFVLFIHEYHSGGANFYISKADRHDVCAMLREWIARQEGGTFEVNPENATTQKLREQWPKIVALLLHKYRLALGDDVTITGDDIRAMEQAYAGRGLPSVMADDNATGLHLRVVDEAEARRLADAAAAAGRKYDVKG